VREYRAALRAFACIAALAIGVAYASPEVDVKAAFGAFVVAQNAHDLKAVGEMLSDSPDFIWIDPVSVVRTRDEALKRFDALFQARWRIDPAWLTLQVVMLDAWTAEVIVYATINNGPATQLTRINQIMVSTPAGWRVLTILADRPQR
jgi:ketosteroid isomerase-like protein